MKAIACLAGALWAAFCAVAAAHASAIDERALQRFVERHAAGAGTRIEVAVGAIDPRRALAPCSRAEPFLPAGARLWGRATVGVRCIEGAAWTTFVPVQVQVFGPALVATRSLPAGKALEAGDYRTAEIDLTRHQSAVIADAAQLQERVTLRPIAAGQPLRADALRARPAIGAGDIVRIVHTGAGFSVSTEGKALTTASLGQTIRVQTESGRVLSGVAGPGRIVEVGVGH